VPEDVARRTGRWGFGCDDCQTACPWNRGAAAASDPDLEPTRHPWLDLEELLALSAEDYRGRFYGTALARAGHAGLVRNGVLVAGANREARLADAVRRLEESELDGVAEAARWASGRLG
jgi:epoxyqueuosine reductase